MIFKKVLITGAAGYIGSSLAKRLAELGNYKICGVDKMIRENDPREYLNNFICGDIADSIYYFGDTKYDIVYHLAGLISVEESIRYPTDYYTGNINSTVKTVKGFESDRFVFASTATAFNPANPYAYSKLACEHIIREHCPNHNIFRFFNVAGSDGKFGQVGKATHLVRVAAEAAAGRREFVSLYGTDYDTSDGTCMRDYVHIDDLIDVLINDIDNQYRYQCIASNNLASNRQVIDTMKKVTGKEFKVVERDRREGDIPVLSLDQEYEKNTIIYLGNKTLEEICLSAYEHELRS